jgi:hypothetical protein
MHKFAPLKFALGVVVGLALLSAACNDPAASPNAPLLPPSSLHSSLASKITASKVAVGTASKYAVLANAAVTCTDGMISGNVGTRLSPLSAPPGSVTQTSCAIAGAIDIGNATAMAAYSDYLKAYAALTPIRGEACDTLTGTLAGVTLAPGTYCFSAAATLTGVLTLNGPANGIWIFKIGANGSGTGALTGTNFSVVMTGGASGCNVTWWVAQAATMTDSHFLGTILAGAAITLTRGTFNGDAWAGASGVGDVTVTGTTVTGCAGSVPPGISSPPPVQSGFLVVCKNTPAGTSGTFEIDVYFTNPDGSSAGSAGVLTHSGQCRTVESQGTSLAGSYSVTSSENLQELSGWSLGSVTVTTGSGTVQVSNVSASNPAMCSVSATQGCVLTFNNVQTTPPPPKGKPHESD